MVSPAKNLLCPRDRDFPGEVFRFLKEKNKRSTANTAASVMLKIFDEMAEAMRTGSPYQTHLDPPPGPIETVLPVFAYPGHDSQRRTS